MPVSQAQRTSANKWDKENMSTLACKVKKDVAEKFKAKCVANNTTVNSVLQSYVNEYLADE